MGVEQDSKNDPESGERDTRRKLLGGGENSTSFGGVADRHQQVQLFQRLCGGGQAASAPAARAHPPYAKAKSRGQSRGGHRLDVLPSVGATDAVQEVLHTRLHHSLQERKVSR